MRVTVENMKRFFVTGVEISELSKSVVLVVFYTMGGNRKDYNR